MPSSSGLRRLCRAQHPAAGLLLALAAAQASAADLTVELLGARSAQGSVNAALYNSDGAWMKAPQMLAGQTAPAAQPRTVLVFKGLKPGHYGVAAYHDENANGKLDTNVVGLPTEPYGASRDARGVMGPPAWADAQVDVQADTAITIHLE